MIFKAKKSRVTDQGVAYIKASFNNTLVTITNLSGESIIWSSGGKIGFKGSKKNTPYAATQAARECATKAAKLGIKEVLIRAKGIGPGKEAAMRGLLQHGIEATAIEDHTPIPHNGCRPPRMRKP